MGPSTADPVGRRAANGGGRCACNLSDNQSLDYRDGRWGYAVFGRVVEGMAAVDAIAGVPTGSAASFHRGVPRQPVVIESARRVAGAQ